MSVLSWLRSQTREEPQMVLEAPVAETLPALAGPREVAVAIRVEQVREDVPKFARKYMARLDERATIAVTWRTYWRGHRSSSGELTQPNGRWVLFDPDRIADKILDPALVPLIQDACRTIAQMDREFIASRQAEFIDEAGATWRRLGPD